MAEEHVEEERLDLVCIASFSTGAVDERDFAEPNGLLEAAAAAAAGGDDVSVEHAEAKGLFATETSEGLVASHLSDLVLPKGLVFTVELPNGLLSFSSAVTFSSMKGLPLPNGLLLDIFHNNSEQKLLCVSFRTFL